jgi:hypothetical protein
LIPTPPIVAIVPGECAGDRIARIVRLYAGCSLSNRRSDLASLVCRGVCDESFVAVQTNCATFALGVLAAAGVTDPVLSSPTAIGAAFSDMVTLGYRHVAWRPPQAEALPAGALMWYRISGTNDDHVEVYLGGGEHGGGGRPGNAVTIGTSSYALSNGRPLWRWLDPEMLQIPTAQALVINSGDPHV